MPWCSADTNLVKIKITEKIQRYLISAVDIPELMRWGLTSNPEKDKALEQTLNPETSFKDRSSKLLKKLEIKQPLGSELVLHLEVLRELCRKYVIEKLNPQDQYSSSRDIFMHFISSCHCKSRSSLSLFCWTMNTAI